MRKITADAVAERDEHGLRALRRHRRRRTIDVVTSGRLLMGGQAEPAWTKRAVVIGPGAMLAFATLMAVIGIIGDLTSGQFSAAGGPVLGLAVFGALLARFLYDFLPRRAWLDGSVLTLEGTLDLRQFFHLNTGPEVAIVTTSGARGLRQCDLASASVIKLRRTMPPMARGYGSVPVLYVRQTADSPPVRLLLRGPDLLPPPPEHLRLLASAIGSRPEPHDKTVSKVVGRLYALADQAEPANPAALDWSFRTDPKGRGLPTTYRRN